MDENDFVLNEDFPENKVYPPEISDFRNWYHGVVDRKEAERILLRQNHPQAFLIRRSPQNYNFVLSSCLDDRSCKHYIIKCKYGILEVGGNRFDDMRELLMDFMGEDSKYPVPPENRGSDARTFDDNSSLSGNTRSDPLWCPQCQSQVFASGSVCPDISGLEFFHSHMMTTDHLVKLLTSHGDGSYLLCPSIDYRGCYSLFSFYGQRIKRYLIRPKIAFCPHSSIENNSIFPLSPSLVENNEVSHAINDVDESVLTHGFSFLISTMEFSSIKELFSYFYDHDMSSPGRRLKQPVTHAHAQNIFSQPLYEPELVYQVLRRPAGLPLEYPTDPSTGIVLKGQLYQYIVKKKEWKSVFAQLDDANSTLILRQNDKTNHNKLVHLSQMQLYSLHESIHNCSYSFMLVDNNHEEIVLSVVNPLLDNHKPSFPSLFKTNFSQSQIHPPPPPLPQPPSFSLTNNTSGSSSSHLDNSGNNNTISSPRGGVSSTSSEPCNLTSLAPSQSYGGGYSKELFDDNDDTIYLRWMHYLSEYCSNTSRKDSNNKLRSSQQHQHSPHPHFYTHQHHQNHSDDELNFINSHSIIPRDSIGMLPHHYRELNIQLLQVSGASSILRSPSLGYSFSCHISFMDELNAKHLVAHTQYAPAVDHIDEGSSGLNRRLVIWKEHFLFEHFPFNVIKVLFSVHHIKKNKKEPKMNCNVECLISDVQPPWANSQQQQKSSGDLKISYIISMFQLEVYDFHYYKDLIEILMNNMATELAPLTGISILGTQLPSRLLNLAMRKGRSLEMLHNLLAFECQSQAEKNTCFRKDNLVTYIVREYLTPFNVGWLRVCFSQLVEHMASVYQTTTAAGGGGGDGPYGGGGRDLNEVYNDILCSLVNGIHDSMKYMPLQLRHICHDLSTMLQGNSTDDPSNKSHATSSSSLSPASAAALNNLIFLRFISPLLALTASDIHCNSSLIDQLWTLYKQLDTNRPPGTLTDIVIKDIALTDEEFRATYLNVDKMEFPREYFKSTLLKISKFITKSAKASELTNEEAEIRQRLSEFVVYAQSPLNERENMELQRIQQNSTDEFVVKPGWSRELAEIQAILLHKLTQIEKISLQNPPHLQKLVKYLHRFHS